MAVTGYGALRLRGTGMAQNQPKPGPGVVARQALLNCMELQGQIQRDVARFPEGASGKELGLRLSGGTAEKALAREGNMELYAFLAPLGFWPALG
ncbi:unnamed protein product [Caretta caretta]